MQNMPMPNKSYAKEMVRRVHGREPEDLLRKLYVDERHSQEEIAEALGLSAETVSRWLREYGITRDDRPAVAL